MSSGTSQDNPYVATIFGGLNACSRFPVGVALPVDLAIEHIGGHRLWVRFGEEQDAVVHSLWVGKDLWRVEDDLVYFECWVMEA